VEPVYVGTIAALYIYPVKSMGGQLTEDAFVNWHGLDGDRKYAFVQDGDTSHFPWLTAREAPIMLHYLPQFVDPANRAKSPIAVKTPAGETLPVEDSALIDSLAAHYSGKFHLIHLNIGVFDAFPISVISTATLKGLTERVGFPVETNRLRANIVIDPIEATDAIEDRWVGRSLVFGAAESGANVAISKRDQRCVMVNYDRETLQQTPQLLKEIAQNREACTGVYGSVIRTGQIRVGDPVFLI
jgi:uncharacterized protein